MCTPAGKKTSTEFLLPSVKIPCFVSFCANECGYIDSGAVPKFSECQEHGVEWFQGCGL